MDTSIQRNRALDGVYCAGISSELSATLNAALGSDFILTADYWVHIDGIYKPDDLQILSETVQFIE